LLVSSEVSTQYDCVYVPALNPLTAAVVSIRELEGAISPLPESLSPALNPVISKSAISPDPFASSVPVDTAVPPACTFPRCTSVPPSVGKECPSTFTLTLPLALPTVAAASLTVNVPTRFAPTVVPTKVSPLCPLLTVCASTLTGAEIDPLVPVPALAVNSSGDEFTGAEFATEIVNGTLPPTIIDDTAGVALTVPIVALRTKLNSVVPYCNRYKFTPPNANVPPPPIAPSNPLVALANTYFPSPVAPLTLNTAPLLTVAAPPITNRSPALADVSTSNTDPLPNV
jgi:hypothetical protein